MEVHDNVELFGRESGFASPAMKVEPEVRPPGLPRPLASSLCRRIRSVKSAEAKHHCHQPPYVALATTCSGAGGHRAFATHPEVCARGGPCLLPFSAAHAHLVTRVPHAKRKLSRAPYGRRVAYGLDSLHRPAMRELGSGSNARDSCRSRRCSRQSSPSCSSGSHFRQAVAAWTAPQPGAASTADLLCG